MCLNARSQKKVKENEALILRLMSGKLVLCKKAWSHIWVYKAKTEILLCYTSG